MPSELAHLIGRIEMKGYKTQENSGGHADATSSCLLITRWINVEN
jgi:hypothetical protein